MERNQLISNARGIGFGLGGSGHSGGLIRNNMVHTIQDVGIGLESAPNALVYNNSIFTENYQNSIEYRFSTTLGVEIFNNLTNRAIASRDGGSGSLERNITHAQGSWFIDAAGGDLHLGSPTSSVVDQGLTLALVSDDFDGDLRPIGPAFDIGADEYGDPPPTAVADLRVTQALGGIDNITITLGWSPPTGVETQAIRYGSARITISNWNTAAILSDALPGSAANVTRTIPYNGGVLYFAHKSYNTEGGWSALSNNAYWPQQDIYLPFINNAD